MRRRADAEEITPIVPKLRKRSAFGVLKIEAVAERRTNQRFTNRSFSSLMPFPLGLFCSRLPKLPTLHAKPMFPVPLLEA